jgi:hypothetical protein
MMAGQDTACRRRDKRGRARPCQRQRRSVRGKYNVCLEAEELENADQCAATEVRVGHEVGVDARKVHTRKGENLRGLGE